MDIIPDTGAKENTPSPVFKIPALSTVKVAKDTKRNSDQKVEDNNEIDKSKNELLSKDLRPSISFRPKSFALPAEIYKPHRPSTSEFLERHIKKKQAKQKTSSSNNLLDAKCVENKKLEEGPIKSKPSERSLKPKQVTEPKLKYSIPNWSCKTESIINSHAPAYHLEVLKNGTIIDKIELAKDGQKEFFSFGRLAECDVMMEHPSISRFHAILQFGMPSENDDVQFQKDGSLGFYLYDLNSTHGTFLNKAQVPTNEYFRVKVGHMMKFGGSSRIYILQGPDDDEEQENEKSATELRNENRKKRNEQEKLAEKMLGDDSDSSSGDDNPKPRPASNDSSGVTWGMLEDAVAEDDSNDDEKEENDIHGTEQEILANLHNQKERFYVKDPHKALKHFFDSEGLEIEFDNYERRPGQWTVRLEVPVDSPSGKPVFAEAVLTGKKRDAVNNCALEACKILDRYGMFNQTENRRRKMKEWEKDDFYDSDEDGYLDRTGDLDAKRQMRKQRYGTKKKKNAKKVDTYESLTDALKVLETEISDIEKQLEKDKEATKTNPDCDDPLEAFMRSVKEGRALDSQTRKKLKFRLLEARKESMRLSKLADIARPANLPKLNNSASKSMAFIGKMKGGRGGFLRSKPTVTTASAAMQATKSTSDNIVEEEDDSDENVEATVAENTSSLPAIPEGDNIQSTPTAENQLHSETIPLDSPSVGDRATSDEVAMQSSGTSDNQSISPVEETSVPEPAAATSTDDGKKSDEVTKLTESVEENKEKKRNYGPSLPANVALQAVNAAEVQPSDETERKKKRRRRNRKDDKKPSATAYNNASDDLTYSDWIPPTDQSGDGSTKLNEKYGY